MHYVLKTVALLLLSVVDFMSQSSDHVVSVLNKHSINAQVFSIDHQLLRGSSNLSYESTTMASNNILVCFLAFSSTYTLVLR